MATKPPTTKLASRQGIWTCRAGDVTWKCVKPMGFDTIVPFKRLKGSDPQTIGKP